MCQSENNKTATLLSHGCSSNHSRPWWSSFLVFSSQKENDKVSLSLPAHGFLSLWTIRLLCHTLPLLFLNLIQLILAVIILSPGFARFAWYYWCVARHETVAYAADSVRQRLDVYPTTQKTDNGNNNNKSPVVLFIPGGGWMIGYKLWGALLARSLQTVGNVTIVMMDYRNYPVGTVPEQLEDVQTAVEWTKQHVHEYGGDPNKLVIVGESAGGHLGAMLLLKAQQQQPPICQGFVSMSAPYDVGSMTETFLQHGLDRTGIRKIFGGSLRAFDPLHWVEKQQPQALQQLPPMLICHGTRDKTVPLQGARAFCEALVKAGAPHVTLREYNGWTHTRGNVEGPMEGDLLFHQDVWKMVQQATGAPPAEGWEKLGRLCPSRLVKLGSLFMPV